MSDRKAIIRHFQDAIQASGDGNKWRFVRADIIEDAIKLLTEDEPRVMTLNEAREIANRESKREDSTEIEPVWLEQFYGKISSMHMVLINHLITGEEYGATEYIVSYFGSDMDDYLYPETYGRTWRVWTSKPSKEQRKETPWT